MAVYNQRKFDTSPAAGFDGYFDWDFLFPAFEGTKIEPMDFDAVIERRGNFLVLETKTSGVEVPMGQVITLESAVKNKNFAVIVLKSKTQYDIEGWEFWHRDKGSEVAKVKFSGRSHDLVSFIRSWFLWASDGGRGSLIERLNGEFSKAASAEIPWRPEFDYTLLGNEDISQRGRDDGVVFEFSIFDVPKEDRERVKKMLIAAGEPVPEGYVPTQDDDPFTTAAAPSAGEWEPV